MYANFEDWALPGTDKSDGSSLFDTGYRISFIPISMKFLFNDIFVQINFETSYILS